MNRYVAADYPTKYEQRLRRKIAGLIFARIGSNLPPVRTVEEDAESIRRLLSELPIGGLVLFNGNWPQTAETLRKLQSLCDYPLIVGSDIERGVGQQVAGLPVFPHAMALGHLGDRALDDIQQFARQTAQVARSCGINTAFAPVADVNTNPQNPIIATRAFGTEPHETAKLVAAYVRSAEEAGMLTTAKHFPGHGDTHQDSHDTLPQVNRDRDALAAGELVPFRAAIEAGVSLIMTAHVAYPKLDPSGVPATLSSQILRRVLRDELEFQGAVCSDSLLMSGVRDSFETEGEMARAALEAGVDVLLDVSDATEVVESLVSSARSKPKLEEQIEEAYSRVQLLRAMVAKSTQDSSNNSEVTTLTESIRTHAQDVARRAVTWKSRRPANEQPLLNSNDELAVLLVGPTSRLLRSEDRTLDAAFRTRFSKLSYFEVFPEDDAAAIEAAFAQAEQQEQLVIAVVVKPAAWHRFGMPEPIKALVASTVKARPTILAALGVPQILDDFPEAEARLCTFSDVPVSQRALAEVLASKCQVNEDT